MEEPRCYIPMMGVRFSNEVPIMSLSSNGRTLIKGYPEKDTVSIFKIPCQGRDPGSNPGNDTKFRMRTANSKIQLLIEK